MQSSHRKKCFLTSVLQTTAGSAKRNWTMTAILVLTPDWEWHLYSFAFHMRLRHWTVKAVILWPSQCSEWHKAWTPKPPWLLQMLTPMFLFCNQCFYCINVSVHGCSCAILREVFCRRKSRTAEGAGGLVWPCWSSCRQLQKIAKSWLYTLLQAILQPSLNVWPWHQRSIVKDPGKGRVWFDWHLQINQVNN